jgi:hypothetical protein
MLNFKVKVERKNAKIKMSKNRFCCGHYLPIRPPTCCSGIQLMVNEHTGEARVVLITSKGCRDE